LAKYLVTGCAGFIGSKVTELLLAEGHNVVGVDNFNDAYDVRLKEWRLAQLQPHPLFDFHYLNIVNRSELEELFKTYEHQTEAEGVAGLWTGVINLAARAGVRQSVVNPWLYFDTNTVGLLNLLELCNDYSIKKLVQASTSSLYGKDNPMPYAETQNTDHPLSPYAASKKAAEALCYTYYYLYKLDITIFRYFTVYGPAGRPDMSLFRFTQWISEGQPVLVFGDGQQSRDFTYVDDIARGTIAGLKPLGFEIINLGSDEPVVLMDAINLIESLVDKKARLEYQPRHSAEILATWADISKAEKLLGWRPEYNFENGIASLVNWYRANEAWASKVRTRTS
jgi:UDP-glucuronate 4-epimerase